VVASFALSTLSPITTEAAWRGDRLSKTQDWVYMLSKAQIDELEALGSRFVEADPDLRFVQAEDYPLAECRDAVRVWTHDVDAGRGFTLVRGLRTHLYSDALSSAIYFILGLHMGDPIRQNELGDILDHVYATSDKTLGDPGALSSKVRDQLVYHRDGSDIVGLMCLRPAKQGGISCLVSSAEVYNEILRRRPDLAPLLFQDYERDWRRQDHDSPALNYPAPVVSIVDGVFNMYAGTLYIFTAQEYPGVPALTPEQTEVLNLLDEITVEPGMAIEMDFRPGDIQWVSNPAIMHARTQFWDYPEPQRRRHLLRLWLSRKGDRPSITLSRHREHARSGPRDGQAADDLGNFNIGVAAVPRLIS
jgi:hypothetical protein